MNLWLRGVKPKSKQNSYGRSTRWTYVKKSYLDWKEELGWKIKELWKGAMFRGAVRLEVDIYWTYPIGDAENLVGCIQDALQGIVYENDCQVKRLLVTLHLVDTPNECGTNILCDSMEDFDGWVQTAMRRIHNEPLINTKKRKLVD